MSKHLFIRDGKLARWLGVVKPSTKPEGPTLIVNTAGDDGSHWWLMYWPLIPETK